MKHANGDPRSPKTGNDTRRKNQRPPATSSGVVLRHFHRSRTRRARKVLDDHYRNLLIGGRLILVEETSTSLKDMTARL